MLCRCRSVAQRWLTNVEVSGKFDTQNRLTACPDTHADVVGGIDVGEVQNIDQILAALMLTPEPILNRCHWAAARTQASKEFRKQSAAAPWVSQRDEGLHSTPTSMGFLLMTIHLILALSAAASMQGAVSSLERVWEMAISRNVNFIAAPSSALCTREQSCHCVLGVRQRRCDSH